MEFRQWLESYAEIMQKVVALEKWAADNASALQNKRIHITDKEMIPFNKSQEVEPGYFRMNGKPFGLWYAFGKDWIDYIAREHLNGVADIIYEVQVNPVKMLNVKTDEQAAQLEKEFGVFNNFKQHGWYSDDERDGLVRYTTLNKITETRPKLLNWKRLSQIYDGIELDPQKVWRPWSDEWAIHSGCVWNKSAIMSHRVLAQYDPTTNQFVNKTA